MKFYLSNSVYEKGLNSYLKSGNLNRLAFASLLLLALTPSVMGAQGDYVGCYIDAEVRDLSYEVTTNYDISTPNTCIQDCKNEKYKYAAKQVKHECFCGNSYNKYGKVDDSECMDGLECDDGRPCGDGWRNSIYKTGYLPPPTGSPSGSPTDLPTRSPTDSPTGPPSYNAGPDYEITLNGCTFLLDGTADIGEITCEFNVKGGSNHDVTSAIYSADCTTNTAPPGVTPNDDTTFESKPVPSSKVNQETSTYKVTISLANNAAVANSNSIKFCLKTEVKDEDDFVQVWSGQKIKLDVATDGTFTTDSTLSTEKFDGISDQTSDAGDVTFKVGVKRCDANGIEVTDDKLSLGENFFLCVEGTQTTVVINSIETLTATKDGVTPLELIDAKTRNSNTFVYGTDTNKVVIATRLSAPFFADDKTVTLSGKANIVTGGVTGSRQLSTRSMQEVSASAAEESAAFSMEVGTVVSDASGALAIKTTAAVFVAFFAALFV